MAKEINDCKFYKSIERNKGPPLYMYIYIYNGTGTEKIAFYILHKMQAVLVVHIRQIATMQLHRYTKWAAKTSNRKGKEV